MNIDRGTNGRNARIRSLNTESHADFVRGFRDWTFGDLGKMAERRAGEILVEAGIDDPNPPIAAIRPVLERDPIIATRLRCWITSQRLMWRGLTDHFGQHRDEYLAEFAQTDASGPGTLQLDPALDIPEYARHEIHLQPGGYVGHEFSGPVYHLGTNSFYAGQNDRDEFHIGVAGAVALPTDGKVARVVDIGCGVGQLTVALKERFPDADVWGVDVGAPMLRYAHHRAARMGVDVNFAQRLAEDMRFDDGSVDVVTAYILFHEVPDEIAQAICAEVSRVLRPGGVFVAVDFQTGPDAVLPPFRKYMNWADHAYNTEPWREEFGGSDLFRLMREAGLETEAAPARHWGIPTYVGRKPG